MYTYRRLTLDELKSLEGSFIRFLAAQSITGQDWENIKENDPTQQQELIDQFSDVVIEKTLHNVKVLEQRTERRIVYFEFLDEKVKLYGIEFEEGIPLDLRKEFSLKDLSNLMENDDYQYDLLSGVKKYKRNKLEEIFEILEQGSAIVQDQALFNSMLKILSV